MPDGWRVWCGGGCGIQGEGVLGMFDGDVVGETGTAGRRRGWLPGFSFGVPCPVPKRGTGGLPPGDRTVGSWICFERKDAGGDFPTF